MILQSKLLNDQEISSVNASIGESSQGIVMTVVRVFFGDNRRLEWLPQGTGVLSLVKDYSRRTYLMQFFNPDSKQVSWEMELYLELRLKFRGDRFYEFEGDNASVAVQFADLSESEYFVSTVDALLTKKRERSKRRDLKRNQDSELEVNNNHEKKAKEAANNTAASGDEKTSNNVFSIFSRNKNRGSKKKRPEISGPSDFKHVTQHRDGKIIEDFGGLDENVRHLLFMAGVNSKEILENPLMKEEVARFLATANNADIKRINRHKETYANVPRKVPPPPPTRSIETKVVMNGGGPPLPPPPLNKKPPNNVSSPKHPSIKPPPPPRTLSMSSEFKVPPPPSFTSLGPSQTLRRPPPSVSSSSSSVRPAPPPPPSGPPSSKSKTTKPVPSGGGSASSVPPPPPPPPPPPIPSNGVPPPPPPPLMSPKGSESSVKKPPVPEFDICSAIKNASLQPPKPLPSDRQKPQPPSGRAALLDDIVNARANFKLKSVAERVAREEPPPPSEKAPCTLTDVLQLALLQIKNDVQESSDSEDEGDSDSTEWSDEESYESKLQKFVR